MRVRDFYRAGGTVIALRRLPYTSVETGRDDPELKAIWEEVFDLRSSLKPYVMRKSAKRRALLLGAGFRHRPRRDCSRGGGS